MRKAKQAQLTGLGATRFLVNPLIRGQRPMLENEGGPVGGSGDSAAPGNAPSATGSPSAQDYTGGAPDFTQFWQAPAEPALAAPAAQPATPAPAANPQQAFAEGIQSQIGQASFGDVITPEVQAQLNNGDFTGLNTGLQTSMRAALSQSVALNAQVMQQFGAGLLERVSQLIQQSGTQRDTRDQLEQNFPIVKDQAVRPLVESIFNQALVRNKNDYDKAVKETKALLGHTATVVAQVPGITEPPASADSNAMAANSKDLVAALLSRQG